MCAFLRWWHGLYGDNLMTECGIPLDYLAVDRALSLGLDSYAQWKAAHPSHVNMHLGTTEGICLLQLCPNGKLHLNATWMLQYYSVRTLQWVQDLLLGTIGDRSCGVDVGRIEVFTIL
jgi:hypothetical protein